MVSHHMLDLLTGNIFFLNKKIICIKTDHYYELLILGGISIYVFDKRFSWKSIRVVTGRLDRWIDPDGLRKDEFRRTTFTDGEGNKGEFFAKNII